jgi:hypothetical protein
MKRDIQLLIFNSFIGNPTGFKLILKQLGWMKGLNIVLKMQLNMLLRNPFHPLNRVSELLTWKERLSQKQILPAFALYDALISKGYSEKESVAMVETVVIGVAKKFLKFTVPVISPKILHATTQEQKTKFFTKIVNRFPNTFGALKVENGEAYHFTVNTCLFASYCKKLNYNNLANIFCKADKAYFDNHQPLINFSRTQTLAGQEESCDFKFDLIAKG